MKQRLTTLGACAILGFAAGCATTPPPNEQMALSRAAVSEAQSAGATEFAPVELRSAQQNLEDARTAAQGQNYDTARRFAERAEVDAKVAETTARSTKAQRAVAELRAGIQTLREEIERSTNR